MWYIIGAIGAIVLFNLLALVFIYSAGKTNKALDKAIDNYLKSLKQKQDGHH